MPIYLLLICLILPAYSQELVTVSGHIRDASNGEELIGTNIYIQELEAGTSTNAYGFYSLSIPAGTIKII